MNHTDLRKRRSTRSRRAGAALFLLLLLLVVAIGMAAFAVDVGRITLLRAEVQNAVDAGALAAGLELQVSSDVNAAEAAARRFVQLNRIGTGVGIEENVIEVEKGRFDPVANTFDATNDLPNAIRVFARSDTEAFSFGRIFGNRAFAVPADAIAAAGSRPLDIMLVLDLSGSMADEGRIQALWTAAPRFVDFISELGDDDRIGVMGLATDPEADEPIRRGKSGVVYRSGLHPKRDYYVGVLEATLTEDFQTLQRQVLSSTNLIAGKYTGYTGTGAALGDAAHYLTWGKERRKDVERAIVLMSDGHANRPTGFGPTYAEDMARYAARKEIVVHTISLGNEADVRLMERIAKIGNGRYFDATGSGVNDLSQKLTAAFAQIVFALKRVQLVR